MYYRHGMLICIYCNLHNTRSLQDIHCTCKTEILGGVGEVVKRAAAAHHSQVLALLPALQHNVLQVVLH